MSCVFTQSYKVELCHSVEELFRHRSISVLVQQQRKRINLDETKARHQLYLAQINEMRKIVSIGTRTINNIDPNTNIALTLLSGPSMYYGVGCRLLSYINNIYISSM